MWRSLTKRPHAHTDNKKPNMHLPVSWLFFFVTKTWRHFVGPKPLRWVSPFPLICWCSFLERRPVCVTTASASPVQGRAEASRLLGGGLRTLLRSAIQPDRSSSDNNFGVFVSLPAVSVGETSWRWDQERVGDPTKLTDLCRKWLKRIL